jgi:hypothetical protein
LIENLMPISNENKSVVHLAAYQLQKKKAKAAGDLKDPVSLISFMREKLRLAVQFADEQGLKEWREELDTALTSLQEIEEALPGARRDRDISPMIARSRAIVDRLMDGIENLRASPADPKDKP